MIDELKCPICGQATRVYMGMHVKIDCVQNMQMNLKVGELS